MRYVSPFALLSIDASAGAADRNALHLARKRLLAEFELAGNAPTVQVNGQEFTKADILGLLDSLQDAAVINHHLTVHRDPALLNFLERDAVPPGGKLEDEPQYSDRSFVAFLSPYFAFSFSNAIDAAFRKRDLRTLRFLSAMPFLAGAQAEENCFRPVRRELQKLMDDVEKLNAGKWPYHFQPREAELFANTTLLAAVDELPARLQSLRDDYAMKLLELARFIWNERNNDPAAKNLVARVEQMRVDEGVKRRARSMQAQMRTVAPPAPSYSPPSPSRPQPSGDNTWKAVLIVLKVIVLIAYISSRNCDSNRRPSRDFNYDFLKNANTRAVSTPAKKLAEKYAEYHAQQEPDTISAGDKKKKKKKKQQPENHLVTGQRFYRSCFDEMRLSIGSYRLAIVNKTDFDLLIFLGDKHMERGRAFAVRARERYTMDSLGSLYPVLFAYAGRDWNDTAEVGSIMNRYNANTIPLRGAFRKPCNNVSRLLRNPLELDALATIYRSGVQAHQKRFFIIYVTADEYGNVRLRTMDSQASEEPPEEIAPAKEPR